MHDPIPLRINRKSIYIRRAVPVKLTPRDKLRLFLEDPSHARTSMVYQIINIAFMIMSTVTYLIITEPSFWLTNNQVLFALDCTSTAFFTTDYFLRFAVRNIVWWRWMLKFFNICDVLSFFPFYIEIILIYATPSTNYVVIPLRIMRTLRVFRIVKMAKYAKMLPVVGIALKKSAQAMLLLFLGLPIALVIIASGIFFSEQTISTFNRDTHEWTRDADGSVSPFQSVPTTFWFTIVTMTTTGFGDTVPQSPTGKAVTAVAMFIGLVVITFPLSIFSTNFVIALREYKQQMDKEKIEKLSDIKKMKKKDLYNNIRQLLSMREDINQKLDQAVELVKVAQEEQQDVDRVLDNLQRYMEQHKLL